MEVRMQEEGFDRAEQREQEAVRERSRVSDEGWRLALGDRLYVTGPKLCHKQELDQKQTEGKGASIKEGTPLKGHNAMWQAAWQAWDAKYTFGYPHLKSESKICQDRTKLEKEATEL